MFSLRLRNAEPGDQWPVHNDTFVHSAVVLGSSGKNESLFLQSYIKYSLYELFVICSSFYYT